MDPRTREAFNAFTAHQERLNGVAAGSSAQGFTVTPSVQQRIENKIQDSSTFLTDMCNVVPVDEAQGQKLFLGVSTPIASRTDTSGGTKRQVRDPSGLTAQGYQCVKTNSDTCVRYDKLDMWAKFPDFQSRIRTEVVNQQGLDRLCIGFNGTHAAANTDLTANPLLQDVNTGWLQAVRADAPERCMETGEKKAGHIYIGEGGDYANLDALVTDAIMLLDPWFREDTSLVAICGRDLLHDKYLPIVNQDNTPINVLAAQTIMTQRRMGSLPARAEPFFPATSIMITRKKNLSLYYQSGKRRSRTIDRPELDQIETYESSNDAYVVEQYGCVALIENIVLGSPPAN